MLSPVRSALVGFSLVVGVVAGCPASLGTAGAVLGVSAASVVALASFTLRLRLNLGAR